MRRTPIDIHSCCVLLAAGSLAAASLAACGTRTSPIVDPPTPRMDGGSDPDAGSDGGVDAGPPDGGVFVVECGRSVQFTSPRRPIELEAEASSPDGIASQGWSLVSSPPTSMPRVTSSSPPRVTLTPDVEGEFLMRFDAVDGIGRSASCEVTVRSVVGPPVAICPEEELRTVQDVPIVIMGDGFDDEMVVAFQWEVVATPPGAMPTLIGADGPVLQFTSGTRGMYQLRLTVFDADMAMGSCDIGVLVTGPPEVVCPASPITGPTRQPISIEARATDDVGIASRRWEALSRPSGSSASPTPADANRTELTPDRQGEYRLRFTATDVEGLTASCEVTVIGTPTPPTVTCPATVTTSPLTPVSITATAVDDGRIVSWRWAVSDRPGGSTASPSPAAAATTGFTPDIAGVYELTVTATDDDGMTGSCVTRVEAGNIDGLRVEMFWDTDSTDMDLHLLNPDGTRWTSDDDCYYGNCVTGADGAPRLSWYDPGPDDDPRLDIDDTNGRGPENINITTPEPGTYRVGVHNYRGAGPHAVTVRIYCGGSTTTPRQTFGPVSLRGRSGGTSSNDFWRVADVTITAAGCTITDLARASGPWIEGYSGTMNMR